MLEDRWKGFSKRINNTSSIFRDRNNIYSNLFYEKYSDLIGNKIELKKINELSESIISDILRYSIKECFFNKPGLRAYIAI